jgi:tetratricopeptide (TPR) repeat protein
VALDDAEARAYACAARRRALWDPARLDERLRTSTMMLTLAREIGNLELEMHAHAWLVVDLLEHGEADAVDAQIEAFAAGAERLRQPMYLWNTIVWRAMKALCAGELEQAEAAAAEALAAGAPVEAVTAPQYYAIQLLAIRREQGRMAELEPAARQMVQTNPHRPAWRAALADLLFESGRPEEAREQFELLAAADFTDIPQDGDWMTAVTLLSDVAAGLGDAARAALLYDLLLPYAQTNVVVGLAAACLGSAGRYLGKLASTVGDLEQASEHFERALEANALLRAPSLLAQTQLDYASALGEGERADELIAAAARAARRLGLPALERRAAHLREQLARA